MWTFLYQSGDETVLLQTEGRGQVSLGGGKSQHKVRNSVVHSQWLRTYITALSLVESFPSDVWASNGGILRSKAPIRGLWMPELVLYGIRLLAPASLGKLWTNERRVSTFLDQ